MSELVDERARGASRPPLKLLVLGALLYLLAQLSLIGVPGISGSSEAREAQVVDTILRDGTWILPLRNGLIPSKPPLFHWLGAGVSRFFGEVSEFTVRMPSQLCAAGLLVLIGLVTFRFASAARTFEGERHARRSALLAAGILSLTYGFFMMSWQAMVDMTFALCVWGALASLVLCDVRRFRDYGRVSELSRSAFWLWCGLGVVARGPLGMALPMILAFVVGCATLGARKTMWEFARPSFGWLALGVPVAWYYAAYKVGGEAFLQRQILFENLERFSGGEFVNSEPWWFYAPSLLRTTFPWGVMLLCIAALSFRSRATVSYSGKKSRFRYLPMIAIVVGVVLFSLSSGKRHSYMLPLIPLIAIQLGAELSSLLERGSHSARVRIVKIARRLEISLVVLGGAGLLLLVVSMYVPIFQGFAPMPVGSVLALVVDRFAPLLTAVCGVALVAARRSIMWHGVAVWLLMLSLQSGIVTTGAALKAEFKGHDVMASSWLATATETDRLVVFKQNFDEYFDPILFYVRRPVKPLPLESFASECESRTVYIAKRAWLDAHESLSAGMIVRVMVLREPLLTAHNDEKRDLVVFRCHRGARDDAFPSPLMHDARLSF